MNQDVSVETKSSSNTQERPTNARNEGKKRIGGKSYKIQIQLSEKARDRLFELVDRTEAETAAQVVRDALRVYDILVGELAENDGELLLRSGKSNETMKLLLF